MKVLHVCGCYLPATEWGGPPPAVAAYARALRSAGVSSEVFTSTARASGEYPPIPPGTREVDGVPVTYFRAPDRYRSFIAPGMIPALLRRVREFDLVNVHMMWAFPGIVAARAAALRGVPYVLTTHGALDPWALEQWRLVKRAFLLVWENRTMRKAGALHFTTLAEQRNVPADVRALPSYVVPNVVDAASFDSIVPSTGREDAFDVLTLGRIHAVKGFDVLVPAFADVLRAEPRARLVVAGNDEFGYRAKVEAMARQAGIVERVEFTGHLDAAGRASALARAALLVAPSYQENFGMAAAEAMAAGLPVIVSDRVNICDDVAAAEAGLVVPVERGAVAGEIVRLLRAPAERASMGARGRELVRTRYAPAPVGRALRVAYERVLGARSGNG